MTSEWRQVVLGSLLGDGGVYRRKGNNAFFSENHSLEQAEYLEWKKQILSRKVRVAATAPISGVTGDELVGFRTGNSYLFNEFMDFRKNPPKALLEEVGPLALAVWFMDDGSHSKTSFRLHTEGVSKKVQLALRGMLASNFGIKTRLLRYRKYYYIAGDSIAFQKLIELCRPYVHPSMAYKFDIQLSTKDCVVCSKSFLPRDIGLSSITCGDSVCVAVHYGSLAATPIESIRPVGVRQVYDFTLEQHHTFFGGGFLNKQCIDEIDTVEGDKVRGYKESRSIPKARNGQLPITLLTSTRKSPFGLVQKELDHAAKTKLHVRHWNIIDVTEACLPERHKPELPKIDLYVNDQSLEVVDKEKFSTLDHKEQEKYTRTEAFEGCRGCVLFSACKTRLATHQKSKAKLLAPIGEVVGQFLNNGNDIDFVQSQLLCRKPSKEGMIYPKLSREVHQLTAPQIYERITGIAKPQATKKDLINFVLASKTQFYSGMDFGYNHNFALVTGFRWGDYFFIIDVISKARLEIEDQFIVCEKVREWGSIIYPDEARPDLIKAFQRRGFRVKKWGKKGGTVASGIEIFRSKLKPAFSEPELYFLKEDGGVQMLFERLENYHYQTDNADEPTEAPEKKDDDECDAARYVIQNVFAKDKGSRQASKKESLMEAAVAQEPQRQIANAFKNQVMDQLTEEARTQYDSENRGTIRKGKFVFSG